MINGVMVEERFDENYKPNGIPENRRHEEGIWDLLVVYDFFERGLINKPIPNIQPKMDVELIYGGNKEIDLVRSFLPAKNIHSFKRRLKENKI